MENSLSIFSLIINAGVVVQVIMLILVVMSVYSWTIILSKKKQLVDEVRSINAFNKTFESNDSLEEIYTKSVIRQSAIERIFVMGYEEYTHSEDDNTLANAERSYRSMNTQVNTEIDQLEKQLSVLAMTASASPYIGLFGTVWGIMHSFIGLASIKQATIAVVAPGIAEALIATAFGLFAAIPATMSYNRLSTQISHIANQQTCFVEKLFVIFQR
jgi:biopolymer transport protein TolQ